MDIKKIFTFYFVKDETKFVFNLIPVLYDIQRSGGSHERSFHRSFPDDLF